MGLAAEHANQFATARAIAERWDCHPDTVYARLSRAGVPIYRFTSRLVRWRWIDVYAFEDSLKDEHPRSEIDELLNYVPRKRAPRGLKVVVDE